MKPLPKGKNDWVTTNVTEVYDNNWISVNHCKVINPGGGDGVYGVVHFKNIAIGVIPIDKDGKVTLVGQFRFPHSAYSWEIPAGGGPLEESPLNEARRELKEETGLISNDWSKVLEMDLSNSVSDEKAVIFIAKDCKQSISEPEETESLRVIKVSTDELYERVITGEVRDSITVAAALWLKINYR